LTALSAAIHLIALESVIAHCIDLLAKNYWWVTISFPQINPAKGGIQFPYLGKEIKLTQILNFYI
jgi:hypothetical protein